MNKRSVRKKPSKLPALVPSIKLGKHRRLGETVEEYTKEYQDKRIEIIERDGAQCQFCLFRVSPKRDKNKESYLASGYLEVHHINDDHTNNSKENLITACPFCHMLFHVGFAGFNKQFTIIRCPWLSQSEINLLTNCLGVIFSRKKTCAKQHILLAAEDLYSYLQVNLHAEAQNEFGDAVGAPESLGSVLYELQREDPQLYANRAKALQDLRILPNIEKFEQHISFWSQNAWHSGPNWLESFEAIYKKWVNEQINESG